MTPPIPQDIAPPPIQASVNNKAVFLCDSNGKFIDKRKLFQPTQDFTFFRCPKIEHARAILQDEIDKESAGHPQLIIIHTGTNDLTTTTPIDDFISDISVLITQASTKFPKSKIVYSTLLPRTDIPLHTLSEINTNLMTAAQNYQTSIWSIKKISSPRELKCCMTENILKKGIA